MPPQTLLIDSVTPLVITNNEAANIARTLGKLSWAKRIVVVDSGSTDETAHIVSRFAQAELIYRPFDTFAGQCNFGLAQVRTEWVLSLDADYELSDELIGQMQTLQESDVSGYWAKFVYRIDGYPLRGSILPPRTILYRRDRATYRNCGHGHKVAIEGRTCPLHGVVYHDDRKPLSRWLQSQIEYARREADYLLQSKSEELSRTDRIRRWGWFAPFAVPLYVLFVKGCILDGRRGLRYTLERLLAETLIALELTERRIRGRN